MASFCLIPEYVDKFKKALRDGSIDPVKLAEMNSESRNKFLADFVGKENATQVNSLFESKLLLKNQQAGMINWAKQVSGITPQTKRDLISRIEKMDKVLNPAEGDQFLKDLAETRLGVGVTQEEAKSIFDLTTKIQDTKAAIPEDAKLRSATRLKHGFAVVNFENYMNDLKLRANRSVLKDYVKNPFKIVGNAAGFAKSLVASFDNSLWGRQGAKTLLNPRTTHIWAKNFLKSWGDIGRELAGQDAIDFVKADIYSRPNAINGKYKAGGYGLDVLSEEAYPSHIVGKIPLLGRLYKASESAYNGGALRLRADLADKWINIAEKQGINTLNPKEAQGIGTLIGSLTGRGNLGKGEALAKEANLLLFSIKFLKSNLDTLTLHALDNKATSFTRKEAAKNLVGMISSLAGIYATASAIDPSSIDLDRQSTNFGKVKVFGQWTDPTGGMASMVTLASRLTPSYHDGKWSFWTKNGSGKWTDLSSGKFGAKTALDVFDSYWQGKLSPAAGIVRDLWAGQTYGGEKPTLINELGNQLPITKQNYDSLIKDPNSSNVFGSLILDGLGLSVSTHFQAPPKDWTTSPTKAQTAFLEKVGEDKFKQANDEYNNQYNAWYDKTSQTAEFKKLSPESQQSLITKTKDTIQQKVFKQYHFIYKAPKETVENKREKANLKKLVPK